LGNISKDQVTKILDSIRDYRKRDISDSQIMHDLALSRASYYRYLRKIHTEEQEAWRQVTTTRVETELFKMKASLEKTFRIADELADNAIDEEVKLMACDKKDDARMSIIQLLTDPDYITKIEVNVVKNQKESAKMDIQSKETS